MNNYLYIANQGLGRIDVFDSSLNSVGIIACSSGIDGLTCDDKYLYFAEVSNGKLWRAKLNTDFLTVGAWSLFYDSPDYGHKVNIGQDYLYMPSDSTVRNINKSDGSLVNSIVAGVSVTCDGVEVNGFYYHALWDTLYKRSKDTLTSLTSLTRTGERFYGITADLDYLYSVSFSTGNIYRFSFDLSSYSVIKNIVPSGFYGITCNGTHLFITDRANNIIYKINKVDVSDTQSVVIASQPNAIIHGSWYLMINPYPGRRQKENEDKTGGLYA